MHDGNSNMIMYARKKMQRDFISESATSLQENILFSDFSINNSVAQFIFDEY